MKKGSEKGTTEGWFVVINPKAGNGKARKLWVQIAEQLQQHQIQYKHIFTSKAKEAIKLSLDAAQKGWRNFIAVGGDGTLHEVLNGIAQCKEAPLHDFCVASMPIGTGNDWRRTLSVPLDTEQNILLIKNKISCLHDVGTIHYHDHDGKEHQRFYINIAGFGFDAEVATRTNRMKESGGGGFFAYIWQLLKSLIVFEARAMNIILDGKEIHRGKLFTLSVGICQYNGGGMRQLPMADPQDGILDVMMIPKIGKWMVLSQIKNLFSGAFISRKEVFTYKGKEVEIKGAKECIIEADGESLGNLPCRITIQQKAVRVICGEEKVDISA